MNQSAALAAFHADAMAAFQDVGLADACTYLAPTEDAEPVPCEAYIDRDVETLDEFGRVMRFAYVVGIRKTTLASVAGAVVATDTESFRLEVLAPGSDEELVRWVATKL